MPLWTMHDGRVRRAELVGVVVVHKETRRCRHATRDGRRHEAIASVVQVHARRGGHATGHGRQRGSVQVSRQARPPRRTRSRRKRSVIQRQAMHSHRPLPRATSIQASMRPSHGSRVLISWHPAPPAHLARLVPRRRSNRLSRPKRRRRRSISPFPSRRRIFPSSSNSVGPSTALAPSAWTRHPRPRAWHPLSRTSR